MLKLKTFQEQLDLSQKTDAHIETVEDTKRKIYRLDEAEGVLRDTGEEYLQDIVDSNKDSVLQIIAERLQGQNPITDKVRIYKQNLSKLDELDHYKRLMEQYKQEFNMPGASDAQVQNAMQQYNNELANAIAAYSATQLPTEQPQEKKEDK